MSVQKEHVIHRLVSALADSDRDGTRRLDGEECAVFYEIGYASSSDASAGKASIEQMDPVDFTTKFIKAMNTNGVDSSVTSQVSTTPYIYIGLKRTQ